MREAAHHTGSRATASARATLAAMLCCLAPPAWSAQAPSPRSGTDPRLELGRPLDGKIRGGTTHRYRIGLAAGEYIHAVVDQLGIDLVVTLRGPDGKVRLELDGPDGSRGPEPLFLIAETPGDHRLEVRALNAAAPGGAYRVSLLERGMPAPRQRLLAEAQGALARAEVLRVAQGAAGLPEALALFERSLALWREADEPGGEARCLLFMGLVYNHRGEHAKAISCWQKVVDLESRLQDPALEASTLLVMGSTHVRLGEATEALAELERAAEIYRQRDDVLGVSSALEGVGRVYALIGEPQRALEALEQSLRLARASGARRDEALALGHTADVHAAWGDAARALALYQQALKRLRPFGDRRNTGRLLNGVGCAYRSLKDYPRALASLQRALGVRREIGDRYGEGATLHDIGAVEAELGDGARALEHYGAALALRRATGDRVGEAITLTSLGSLLAASGERAEASELYEQALTLRRAIGDRRGEADTLFGVARLLSDEGRIEEARATIVRSLELVESLRARVQNRALRTYLLGSTRAYHDLEIALLMRRHREDPSGGWAALALRASEGARARGLLDTLVEGGADLHDGAEPSLIDRKRRVRRRLVEKLERHLQLLSHPHSPADEEAAEREIAAISAEDEALEAAIRSASPRYAALTRPRILDAAQIQALLDEDTALLEYALGEERSYAWVVTREEVSSYALSGRARIEVAARAVHRALEAHKEADLSELAAAVLAPLAGHLTKKRVVVVADGALALVPFAVLPVDGVPLLADHEVVSLPSVSALAVLRHTVADRPRAPKTLAVLADPVFDAADPRVGRGSPAHRVEAGGTAARGRGTAAPGSLLQLPRLLFSRREARDLLGLVPTADRKEALDFDASRATATSPELSQYRLVHFATHGLLNGTHPELSGIVLSLVDPLGRPQDGFLTLPDVLSLRLSADLVTLSSCRSALGSEIPGEGFTGLARAFMHAGAPRVVASLWTVDDAATAELMKRFYAGLLGPRGLTPAGALRAAQLDVRSQARWRHPYYWAGFVLEGDWR